MGFLDTQTIAPLGGVNVGLGTSGALQSINNASGGALNSFLGLGGRTQAAKNTASPSQAPWASASAINSAFFTPLSIDTRRWDQLFPYRLMVVDVNKGNTIVKGQQGVLIPPRIVVTKGTSSANVLFEPADTSWLITLPITPQQLNIVDEFAINTSATLRGILEEHSGVRFKNIVASGTFGVWPFRSNVNASQPAAGSLASGTPPASPGLIQSFFGGTLEASGKIIGQVSNVINTVTSNHPATKPSSISPDVSEQGIYSTGYFFALALQQFLENYAEAKKDPKKSSWRLVLDIPKQNQSFVVTPIQYQWSQNATRAMEIMYTFQLKAWRRIQLNVQSPVAISPNTATSPGLLQKILSTVSNVRQVMSGSKNILNVVGSDVNVVKNIPNPFA